MKWLKLVKFFLKAPGWLKSLLVVVLLLGLILAPVLGLVFLVLLIVGGVGALLLSPLRALVHRIK